MIQVLLFCVQLQSLRGQQRSSIRTRQEATHAYAAPNT